MCSKCTDGSAEYAALLFSVECCTDFYTLKMEATGFSEVAIRLNRITSLKLVSITVTYLKITNLLPNLL